MHSLRVDQQLKMIENLIDGSANPIPSDRAPQLSCKSRDQDHLAPFIFVERMANGQIQNLSYKFKTKENCELSILKTQNLAEHGLFCVSRDGDDINPIHLLLISTKPLQSSQYLMTNYKFKTFENCFKTLVSAQIHSEKSLNFCVSRDGDDHYPYKMIIMNLNGEFYEDSNQYRTFEECQSVL